MNKKAIAIQNDMNVLVSTLADACAAVTAAQGSGRSLLLVTEPEACARLGPQYLFEMARQAGFDGETVGALIDCGSDAGYAMLALRVGWKDLHLTGTPDTVERIAQMIEATGGRFHANLPPNLKKTAGLAVDQSR